MKTPFRSQPTITQVFANNPTYYGQFKLKGHEGIDLIPSGIVWDVLALEDGVVVLDDDVVGSVSSDPYGKIVTIWHTKINKATMYCHLSENFVSLGQIVKKGEKIGTMGSTGNSSGAHLHLNLFETDSNGVRQNRDNGFLGGIDPLPWLKESAEPLEATQQQIDQLRAERDTNWNLYQNERNAKITQEGVIDQQNKLIAEKQRLLNDQESFIIQYKDQIEKLTQEKQNSENALQLTKTALADAKVELSVCNGLLSNRKDLAKFLSSELKTELKSRDDVSWITKLFL